MKVAPSILSADFSRLKEEIASVKEAEWIHIDVMDGHFVPNLTIGPVIVSAIRPHSQQVFDTHLMITNPKQHLDAFIDAGSDHITFHIETVDDPDSIINYLHDRNIKAGISIKPNTAVEAIKPYLDRLDLVLVMSVEPGFGGQAFMPESLPKIKWLSEYKKNHNKAFDIVVDGGINEDTARQCQAAGATVLVAGSFIFKSNHRLTQIKKVRG